MDDFIYSPCKRCISTIKQAGLKVLLFDSFFLTGLLLCFLPSLLFFSFPLCSFLFFLGFSSFFFLLRQFVIWYDNPYLKQSGSHLTFAKWSAERLFAGIDNPSARDGLSCGRRYVRSPAASREK